MVGVLYAAVDPQVLVAIAQEFSPRVEVCGAHEVVLDVDGVSRLFGDGRTLAEHLRRTAAERGVHVRVAIAGTTTAARLLVHHRLGLSVVAAGHEADVLAPLPIALLRTLAGDNDPVATEVVATLRRWGLRTLGEVAALEPAAVTERLGQSGARWQRLARGEDPRPLVPEVPEERFEEALDLEWPIEGLEPLSFVLGRLMEPLAARLVQRDRAVAVLYVRLHLVTREVHERSIELPAAIRDARTLRTLALLDLESHPPAAAIDRVVVAIDPTPSRVVQFSLLTRAVPTPDQLSTLMARLQAVMGEGRCGTPALVDSWAPGRYAVTRFAPETAPEPSSLSSAPSAPVAALRRFRYPVPARVRTEQGAPVHVGTDRRSVSGGAVTMRSGPWRTSGGWWDQAWDRDEWEVTLHDGVSYRLFRERDGDAWFIDAVVD